MAAPMSNALLVLSKVNMSLKTCCMKHRALMSCHKLYESIKLGQRDNRRSLKTSASLGTVYDKRYVEPIVQKDINYDFGDRVFYPVKALLCTSDMVTQYHDPLVERFINVCMSEGKRDLSKEVIAKTFEKIKLIQVARYHKAADEDEKSFIECDPFKIFHRAFENIKPAFMFMRHIKGGTIYMVPVAARPNQAELIAFNWLREVGKTKPKNISFWDNLARELVDASNNTGRCVKRKLEHHRKAEANKAYAHFVW